jgi:hypothetical protein
MYDKYRIVETEEEYYKKWKNDVNELTPELKEKIYKKYVVKSLVFQRAKFKCENKDCSTPTSKLTLHHIKFEKNGGKTSIKNCACVCKACHGKYHRGLIPLILDNATYKLHKSPGDVNWKVIRKEMKNMRKSNREYWNVRLDWKMIELLMKFLNINYSDYSSEDDD